MTLNLDTLPERIELEKNTAATFCRDGNAPGNWIVSNAFGTVLDENCFLLETPNVTGTVQLSFADSTFHQKKGVHIAVGMKVLNLDGQKGKIGFHGEDYNYKSNRTVGSLDQESNRIHLYPERIIDLEGSWLVDKYPVTNCDFVLTMGDSISTNFHSKHNALVYANRRSEREGLSPAYSFKLLKEGNSFFPSLHADGSFEIYTASFFKNYDNRNLLDGWIRVKVDTTADGYRLPYHDEWMALARGGDLDGVAFWDSDTSAKDYAWFGDGTPYRQDSRPVGMLISHSLACGKLCGFDCTYTGEYRLECIDRKTLIDYYESVEYADQYDGND